VIRAAARYGLAADNKPLGIPEFGSILVQGLCGMALPFKAAFFS
jgi:hypothetical protein